MPELVTYNIRKEKYAHSLRASGVANRWNRDDEFVVYTASSRALAALELVAHRASVKLGESYRLLVIKITFEEDEMAVITPTDLPENWRSVVAYPALQQFGSDWYQAFDKLMLQVPSALIPQENNFLINTRHPAFHSQVKLVETEDFSFDHRLL